MKCKICGSRIADDTSKCSVCGTSVSSTVDSSIVSKEINLKKSNCPKCNSLVVGEHRYCPNCNWKLGDSPFSKSDDVFFEDTHDLAMENIDDEEVVYCTNCRNVVKEGSLLCSKCGTKLDADDSEEIDETDSEVVNLGTFSGKDMTGETINISFCHTQSGSLTFLNDHMLYAPGKIAKFVARQKELVIPYEWLIDVKLQMAYASFYKTIAIYYIKGSFYSYSYFGFENYFEICPMKGLAIDKKIRNQVYEYLKAKIEHKL